MYDYYCNFKKLIKNSDLQYVLSKVESQLNHVQAPLGKMKIDTWKQREMTLTKQCSSDE